ncbi:MAG: UDP-N-acetylmuramate--L-alanine ligase [Ignavibacteria bacterium]|nr:UDP-N-acetylmuramate--L-alanine ligase [Ignavibacteria bacterium]
MSKLYFIGIGGTAMGAVALACRELGHEVSGSDANVYPPMSDFLSLSGIKYYEGFSPSNIQSASPDTIVVGNSVSRGNPELEYCLNERFPLVSMPDIVREFLIARHTSIVITGTHGKTTTSSITAWLLETGELNPGFLIGGIPGNFTQGCRPVQTVTPDNPIGYFVSEGDEYDTAFFDKRSKFLLYRPDIGVLNNIEFDHADIFSSLDDIKKSFRLFVRLIPQNGLLLVANEDANCLEIAKSALTTIETFGVEKGSFWRAVDVHYSETGTSFTLHKNGKILGRFSITLLGEHNLKNSIAAIAIAFTVGLTAEQIQLGFNSFKLPKRRLETIGTWHGAMVIDDFAHHPTAITETLKALRQKFPQKRIIACFEPRSNSTTRNIFQHELTECFNEANVVVIGALNRPERYPENERLDTESIANSLRAAGKKVLTIPAEQGAEANWGKYVLAYLEQIIDSNDVIILLSNGDFGGLRKMLVV